MVRSLSMLPDGTYADKKMPPHLRDELDSLAKAVAPDAPTFTELQKLAFQRGFTPSRITALFERRTNGGSFLNGGNRRLVLRYRLWRYMQDPESVADLPPVRVLVSELKRKKSCHRSLKFVRLTKGDYPEARKAAALQIEKDFKAGKYD